MEFGNYLNYYFSFETLFAYLYKSRIFSLHSLIFDIWGLMITFFSKQRYKRMFDVCDVCGMYELLTGYNPFVDFFTATLWQMGAWEELVARLAKKTFRRKRRRIRVVVRKTKRKGGQKRKAKRNVAPVKTRKRYVGGGTYKYRTFVVANLYLWGEALGTVINLLFYEILPFYCKYVNTFLGSARVLQLRFFRKFMVFFTNYINISTELNFMLLRSMECGALGQKGVGALWRVAIRILEFHDPEYELDF